MIPHSLAFSKYTRNLTIDLADSPIHLLHHSLTGKSLKISPATKSFLFWAKRKKTFTLNELQKIVDKKSATILELFLQHKFFVPTETTEIEMYFDQYPVSLGALSYFKNKKRTYSIPVWTGKRYKTLSYQPSREALDFLERCDGNFTLLEILQSLKVTWRCSQEKTLEKICKLIKELTAENTQLIRFSKENIHQNNRGEYLFSPSFDFSHSKYTLRTKRSAHAAGINKLEDFHQSQIESASEQFDQIEVTVSHAFREPTSALGNRSYAGALLEESIKNRLMKQEAKFLEVGGGTGRFAKAFLQHAKEINFAIQSYEILDLSPELQKSQKILNELAPTNMKYHLGSAENWSFPKNSFDFIVSNEVIADFSAVRLEKCFFQKKLSSFSGAKKEAIQWIRDFQLPLMDAPDIFYFNLGAARFIKNIFQSLKAGGSAFVSEFGGVASYPDPTVHLNHNEYSIHWGQMAYIAKCLGFKSVELVDLASFLKFNPFEPMLVSDIYSLQEIFRKFQSKLPSGAYSKQDLKPHLKKISQAKLQGLEYAPLKDRNHWGPSPYDFQILLLQK
jgi:SAM-dependent methyltransferase